MSIQEYLQQLKADFDKFGLQRVAAEEPDTLTNHTFKVCFINKFELSSRQTLSQDIQPDLSATRKGEK
ncbi:hypothetical protein COR50_06030 [Chitinophaga caeni]|uniref:Uncharacterized protein n=1 Tax=Chitinophaga caeni TaxID=2029983 RepID=A0A291QRZ6_9BACT|nr:hypothetical protein [Chitinophaga caeni]ATL46768.1 hypothetical protein COR50_06030 [Chitinophaga caeni]